MKNLIIGMLLFPLILSSQKKFDKDVEALGTIYDERKYDETIRSCQDYLIKNEKKLNNYNRSLLHSYIGLSYLNKKDYANSEKYLAIAVQDVSDSTEETKWQHAQNRYYLATLYNVQGRYVEADPLYRLALPLLATAYGQQSEKYCSMFKELAEMYVEMGRFNEAYPMINAALGFYRVLKGEKDKEFLKLLNDMGRIYQGVGNFAYASLYFDTALTVFKNNYSQEDPENFAIMINNTGENYRRMGEYTMAEQYLKEAYDLSEKFPLTRATTLNNLGLVYKSRGMFIEAEGSFTEAINIYKQQGMENSLDAGYPWNGLGDLYRNTGRVKQAIAAFQKVINIREAVGSTNHTSYANVLTNVGLTYIDVYRYDEAEQFLQAAYKIYTDLAGENHQLTANCLYNLGALMQIRNNLDKAEEYKLKAIQAFKEQGVDKTDRYSVFLSGMATLYSRKKQFDKALQFLEEAEKSLKENFGGKNYNYYDVIYNKAELYRQMGKHDLSANLFVTAIEGYRELLRDFFPYMNEDEKLMVHLSMSDRFELFFDFVYEVKQKNIKTVDVNRLTEVLYDFQLFSKSSLLNESSEFRRSVYASGNKEIVEQYEYLVELRKHIGNRYRMTEEQLLANGIYVDSLEMQAGQIEKDLNIAMKNSGNENSLSWKNIAAKLDAKSAAVEIVKSSFYDSDTTLTINYAALIVKRESKSPEFIILESGNKLDEDWANEYRKNILDRKPDNCSYARYWRKMDEALKNKQHVYFSGDGIYLQINLNTLYNPLSKKYLLEEKDIHLVTNTKDILKSSQPSSTNKNATFFGYPDYEYDFVAQRAKQKEETLKEAVATRYGFYELSPLPGTKKEVKDLSKVFSDAGYTPTTFLETEANEKNLKAVSSPLVLHIATHGFFLPDIKTNDKKIMGFSAEKVLENPLLRSGVMMAGASVVARDTAVLHDEDEDGILTAYEASFMNLQGTEMVVLSACQTGLGETLNGQGVYGLQRSFLIAGARSLLMSMWVVDDYATQELMVEFFKEWLKDPKTENKLPAFKKAQLKVKEKYEDPFFWGAFVMLEK